MSSYTLEWPGDLNIPFVIIDPNTNKVFSKDKPLPPEYQKFYTFENKYVKLSSVLSLFPEKMEQNARWILKDMMERFSVKQLVTVTLKVHEKCVTSYLPLSTLLVFIMIWPCCKAFQSIREAIFNFLDYSSEALCQECGWTRKHCECNKSEPKTPTATVIGYMKHISERGSQTDKVKLQENSSNTQTFIPPRDDDSINVAYLMSQNAELPQIFPPVVGTPVFPSQSSIQSQIPRDNSNCPQLYQNAPLVPPAAATGSNMCPDFAMPHIAPVIRNMPLPYDTINSNDVLSSTYTSPTVPFRWDPPAGGVNYIRPLDANNEKMLESLNTDNQPQLLVYNLSSEGHYCDDDDVNKRKLTEKTVNKFNDKNNGYVSELVEPRVKKARYDETDKKKSKFQACGYDNGVTSASNSPSKTPKTVPTRLTTDSDSKSLGKRDGRKKESSPWKLVQDDCNDEMVKCNNDEAASTSNSNESFTGPSKTFKVFEHSLLGDNVIRCTVCGQCFDDQKAVNLHHKVHLQGRLQEDEESRTFAGSYKCLECNFTLSFPQWYYMLKHMENKHGIKISEDENTCGLCGLQFKSSHELDHHMDFHSNNKYRCIHCGAVLFSWNQVQQHLESCNKKVESIKTGKLDTGCPYCQVNFQKGNVRDIHLRSHTDSGLVCVLCGDKIPKTWKSLKKHYDQKHAKELNKLASKTSKDNATEQPRCMKCDTKFKSFDTFAEHMCKFHQWVPYTLIECPQCDRHFRTEKSLNWHVREVHLRELPCDKCSYVTTSKSLLKLHINKKHTERDYSCTECGMSFNVYHQLRTHMAHHALKTSYTCQHCDKEFSKNSDLRLHQQQDHHEMSEKAPESCPECEFRCFSKSSLSIHIKRNHPELTDTGNKGESDHNYLNKTIDAPSPLTSLNDASSKLSQTLTSVSKRGRKRKICTKYDWNSLDDPAVDNKRDKKKMKSQKEFEERLRRLLKETCARTRTYGDSRAIKNYDIDGGSALDQDKTGDDSITDDFKAASSPSLAPYPEETCPLIPAGSLAIYPYIDHSYCKFDFSSYENDILLSLPNTSVLPKAIPRLERKPKPATRVCSPFQESPNPYVSFPLRTTRRQAALVGNANIMSSCYSPPDIKSSIVPMKNPLGNIDIDSLYSEITELDILAENELLKSTGGYCLVQDILNSSPSKNKSSLDSPDYSVPPDLESIDLCDDDFKLLEYNQTGINGLFKTPEKASSHSGKIVNNHINIPPLSETTPQTSNSSINNNFRNTFASDGEDNKDEQKVQNGSSSTVKKVRNLFENIMRESSTANN